MKLTPAQEALLAEVRERGQVTSGSSYSGRHRISTARVLHRLGLIELESWGVENTTRWGGYSLAKDRFGLDWTARLPRGES